MRQLVCLNNRNGTRIDIRSNTLSNIDLTLISNNLASSCESVKLISGEGGRWGGRKWLAIKERNSALRVLRSNLNQENMLNYQRKKALARRVIKNCKRNAWRNYCSTLWREVQIGAVWSMLKKMNGKKIFVKIPVLEGDGVLAITDKVKANILGKNFASVHSDNHLDDLHRHRKEEILNENRDVYRKKDNEESAMDSEITMNELVTALNGTGYTATGEDQLSYAMFRKVPEEVLKIILQLFNKIWEEGKMPKSWKSAVILPFNKPGKDPNNAGNYRPIALTSHLCKWMEKILVRRLNYFLEHTGLFASYQSGFRKGCSTMDAVVKVSNEIEKTFKMKE